jgi:inner membrane protein involved in colicin E2 resistance
VDHLLLTWAFGISGAVSMLLVVSYLRLVVSDGFAFGPAAAAQGIYQVGFGLAHFWTGFTGLSVTILGILTLFFMMQVTGRTDWEEVFASEKPSPA